MYVVANKTAVSAIRNGHRYRTIFSILIPATAPATNRLHPYGGVTSPIVKLIVSIIPNVIGDIPRLVTTGSKIGEMMIVAGMLSTNIPMISNARFIIIKRIYLLSVS